MKDVEADGKQGLEPDREVQHRILTAVNAAHRAEDVADVAELDGGREAVRELLEHRDKFSPFGFREMQPVLELLDREILEHLIGWFGPRRYGRWSLLPFSTQHPDGSPYTTAHAALLHTDRVLFLPSWDPDRTETLLWDFSDLTTPQFEYPAVQPSDLLFCAGHVFLADGQLLTMGGGGNYISNAITSGWRFDPSTSAWHATANSMSHARWYPTAVYFDPGKVFIASGYGVSACEMYYEATDTFGPVSSPPTNPGGADRAFPETYPGLHPLPGGEIFFSRTGWHGPDDTGAHAAYFRFTGPAQGEWVDIIPPDPMNHPDRTEGMSVLLLDDCGHAKVMVIAGGLPDAGGRDTAEMIDLSTLNPRWPHPMHLPEERLNVNAVLLPDGEVFVLGGIGAQDSPCLLLDPRSHSWTHAANLKYRRQYHSVALLLPTGQVMTTGGDTGNDVAKKTTIEIFDPPYLFRGGTRPRITTAPDVIHEDSTFEVRAEPPPKIEQIVLMRPMAVTHHTDTEQRRLELSFERHGNKFRVAAPRSGNATTPRGYYMMFAIDDRGVPSVAHWVRLA